MTVKTNVKGIAFSIDTGFTVKIIYCGIKFAEVAVEVELLLSTESSKLQGGEGNLISRPHCTDDYIFHTGLRFYQPFLI
jgi:hypothetical protein